ncbi:uncharacterized protein BDV14DRAFT_55914 [Aspergillus stella-maris]|uniref:uncharacterized protein n=1 Tax=Aspergillus stella-maris TaxID=1810926 RepID=UPI003CCCD436
MEIGEPLSSKMYTPTILLSLLPLASSFSLNTKTKYWAYTTSSLANSTSEPCKKAYSAEIDCDEYLVALVNANEDRPYLPSMEASDFEQTCTQTCHDSLMSYIENIEDKCSGDEDAALRGKGKYGEMEFENVPVSTVGRIFEYTLMRSCAVDETGENCYITQSSFIPYDLFTCDWTCAVAYWYNQHEYPYSEWQFGSRYYGGMDYEYNEDGSTSPINLSGNVLVQHSTFEDEMEEAWSTVQECQANSTAPHFQTGIKGVDVGSDTAAAVEEAETSGNSTSEKASTGGSSSNGTTASTEDVPEDAAVGVRVAAGWATTVILVSSLVYVI